MNSSVLLIEPDRVLAKTYRHALESAGYQVTACLTAQGAIVAADEVKPDILIVELQLVEHSGVEFLYEFRSYPDWQHVPVIVHTRVQARQLGTAFATAKAQLGIVEYLYKPQTSLQSLLDAVRQAQSIAV